MSQTPVFLRSPIIGDQSVTFVSQPGVLPAEFQTFPRVRPFGGVVPTRLVTSGQQFSSPVMNNPSSNIKRTVDNGKSSHLMGLYIKDTKYYKGPLVHYMHEAILKKVEQRLEEYYGKYFLIRDGELSGYFYMVASTIKNDIINSDFGATMEQLKSAYKFLRNLDAKLYKIFPKLSEVVATTTEKYVYDMVPEYRKSMTIPQAGPVAGGGTPNPLGRNSLVTAQGILSSHTTSQPTQILIPKIITTNRPVTISTTQNVLSSQIYTIERPLDVITNRSIQNPTGN